MKYCALLTLSLLASAPALAADRTFRNSSGSNFSTVANWVEGVVPTPAQTNDRLRLLGSNFTGAANNNISGLEFATVAIDHSSSGERRLTGNELRLRALDSFLGSGREFYFDVPLTLPTSAIFDQGGNGTNKLVFNQPVNLGGGVLTLNGRLGSHYQFIGQLTASSRSLTSPLITIRTGGDVSLGVHTAALAGAVDVGSGRTIFGSLPGCFVNLTDAGPGGPPLLGTDGNLTSTHVLGRLRCGTGIISPGETLTTDNIGQIEVTGDFTMSNATDECLLRIRLERNPLQNLPRYRSDHIIAKGSVSLTGTLEILAAPPPNVGESYFIIDKQSSGNVSGDFINAGPNGVLAAKDGASLYRIDYRSGTGNDVMITRVSNSSSVPVITSITREVNPSVPANDNVTIAGTASAGQHIVLQSSSTLNGFTDAGTVVTSRLGTFSVTRSVPRGTRTFFRFRTLAD